MSVPAGIAAEAAIVQQQAQLSLIKQASEADRAIATILEESLTVTASGRGSNVNISA